MKKFVLSLATILCLSLTACGQAASQPSVQGRTQGNGKTVRDVLEEKDQESVEIPTISVSDASTDPVKEQFIKDVKPEETYEVIDVDLTSMSSTLVYSEVYDMITNFHNYVGKVIKMNGIAEVWTDPNTNVTYRTCIIQDATACCAQGIEFELTEGADQVKRGDAIVVIGVFDVYFEGEIPYCTLRNAIRL